MASKTLALADPSALQHIAQLAEIDAVDAVSLTLDTKEPMTFDRWQDLGRFLGSVKRSSDWWIGDWLVFGEASFGEEFAQAIEATTSERWDEVERVTGLARDTLLNYVRICVNVPKSRRRKELSFSMHEPVAALTADEQKEWLQLAIDNGWKRGELRDAISEARNPTGKLDDVGPGLGGNGSLTLTERLEAAARLVFHQGQPQRSGDVLVPGEAWQHLVVALGEE